MKYLWRSLLLLICALAVAQLAIAVEPVSQGAAAQPIGSVRTNKTNRQASVPVIQIDEPDYNFGTAEEGSIIVHKFRVKNQGSADLHINRVRPG